MDRKLTVLAIGAHPDDVEISMMGTLIKYKEQGHNVYIVVATDGQRGGTVNGKELAEIRKGEALAAAAHIGVVPKFLGFEDGRLVYDKESYKRVLEIFDRIKPDVVFTHCTDDYHADHRALSRLVLDSSWAPVFFADNYAGVGFQPQFYVDITKQFELKKKALLEYVSQKDYSVLEMTELLNRFRGMQCEWGKVKYAEGFTCFSRYRFVSGYWLLPE